MAGTLASTRSVRGLIPALDRKQVGDAFVCDGENFVVDAQGPYSGLGNEWSTYELLADRRNVATFRIEDRNNNDHIFVFTEDSVLELDPVAARFIPLLVFETLFSDIAPWTFTQVGGKFYFSRRGAPLIQYDPEFLTWKEITDNVPNNPTAVTQSAGRLVILGDDVVGWSAIDNGEDLTPNVDTGAGQQSLAIVGNGFPYKVLKTNDGFISYTSTGLMKSEAIDALNPFRHYQLVGTDEEADGGDIPIDAFNVISLQQGAHVILGENGLRITSGRKPEEWQPLFSEFLRRQVFPPLDLTKENIISISYSPSRQWFIISVSSQQISNFFDKGWILYTPRDEWGQFERDHTAFGDFGLTPNTTKAKSFGYIGQDGCVHRYNDFPSQEFKPPFNQLFYNRPGYEYPARLENGKVSFPSVVNILPVDKGQFPGLPGFYYYNTFIPYERNTNPVNSFIDVGVFRYTNEADVDAVSFINGVSIGMLEEPQTQTFIDMLLPIGSEVFVDMATEPDIIIDMGSGVFSGIRYTAEIISTLDGYNVYENQQQELTEIDPTPLTPQTERTKFFDSYTTGMYHIIRIKAFNEGESFHLKSLEMSGILAGRL